MTPAIRLALSLPLVAGPFVVALHGGGHLLVDAMAAAPKLRSIFAITALGITLYAAVDVLRHARRRSSIKPVPGTLARAVVRCLPFSKRGKAEVFDQLAADMLIDHIEAVKTGKWWLPHLVELHGYVTFAVTLVVYIGSAGLKRFIEIWKLV